MGSEPQVDRLDKTVSQVCVCMGWYAYAPGVRHCASMVSISRLSVGKGKNPCVVNGDRDLGELGKLG